LAGFLGLLIAFLVIELAGEFVKLVERIEARGNAAEVTDGI
jgi:hypothetical protein